MSGATALQLAVNAVWQGLLLVAAVAVVMRCAGVRLSAAMRYAIWCATLIALALMPFRGMVRIPERAIVVIEEDGAPASRRLAGRRPAALPERDAPRPALQPASKDAGIPMQVSASAIDLLLRAYVVIVCVLLLSIVFALLRMRRMRATMHTLLAVEPVRVGLSDAVTVPVTLGVFRPVILLPSSLVDALDATALRQVILHEQAHVARRDDWARLGERIIAALLFFHPAVHLAIRRIALERELACDEWVVARSDRDAYARCLLRVGELAIARTPALALPMASQLAARVQALLAPRRLRKRHHAALALLALACTTGLIAMAPNVRVQLRTTGDAPQPLQTALRRYEAYGFHGAVLVARGGEVILRDGYGLADRTRGTAWTADTAFNGGAVAKMLTSAAILKLEEEGRLRVTDRLSAHLGAFPGAKNEATIHHLLTHTAGLARPWAPINRARRDDFVAAMKTTPADYAPGMGHRYTDHGHALLAAVVEVASGMRYEDYLRRALLEPAGMHDTRFEDEPATLAPLAIEYARAADAESRVAPRAYTWGRRGAMGVITTLDDLFRFHRALERGALLGADARARMFTAWVDSRRGTGIGYGWEVGRSDRGTRLRHRLSGWPGNSVEIVYDEEKELFIALVANSSANWTRPKYVELLNAALGRPHLLPPEPRTIAPRFAGRYATELGPINVRSAGAALRITAAPGNAALTNLLGGHRAGEIGASVIALPIGERTFAILDWSRHRTLTLRFDGARAVWSAI